MFNRIYYHNNENIDYYIYTLNPSKNNNDTADDADNYDNAYAAAEDEVACQLV